MVLSVPKALPSAGDDLGHVPPGMVWRANQSANGSVTPAGRGAGRPPLPMLGAVHVSELWRYPVKSLRGERLDAAHVQSDGVVGDRSVMEFDGDGGFVTARTCPGQLGLSATHGSSTLVNGQAWDSEAAGHAVREAAGPDAHLAASAGHRRRFDAVSYT